MRRILAVSVLACGLLLTGCLPWKRDSTSPPIRPGAGDASQAYLIRSFNDNAGRIQSLESMSLDIDAAMGGQQIGGTGVLACQKPRNFRLQGKFIAGQADVGSNDQEFWYWISKAEPPYLVHCSYADLNTGKVQLPFPFQPEWIMEALGMAELDPNGQYQVRDNKDYVELIQTVKPTVKKVVVFGKSSINAGRPQVVGYALRNDKDQEMLIARIKDIQYDKSAGVILPKKIELICPGEKQGERVSLMLTLGKLQVNSKIDQNRASAMFTRPQLANVPTYDLGRRMVDSQPSSYVQQAGGRVR